MEKGREFLREQVQHAAAQHQVLVDNVESDKDNASDPRVRNLCNQHLPRLREHQVMLESYQDTLSKSGEGGKKGGDVLSAVGSAVGRAREAVRGTRRDDFDRLTDDLASIRQLQDTFALFADVGDRLNEPELAELGRHGASDHEEMQREFYDLAQTIFLEQVGMGGATEGRAAAD